MYKHARWLRKGNILKKDPAIYPKVERLIRFAAAYGHDKANLELRELIERGQAISATPVTESVNLVEDLVRRNIPGGYFDMGRYLLNGYGVKRDPEAGMNYIRKAADLGNPEAQYWIGVKLSPINKAPDIAAQMMLCAGEQGHKVAAQQVGVDFQTDGDYKKAVYALQLGVKAGSDLAAGFLEGGFNCEDPRNRLHYMALTADAERSRRYKEISYFLGMYEYLNPSVPELDDIVPLPPAKLPPWNGKFKWLEEHNANVPPPIPSETRIAEMAKAKGLDPATGRPLAWGNMR
ncbi:MAG: sel1 repeat family protein [Aquabacterium sp.]|uniref:SEL1-like repeat protein n=1 Tax=Aquabacterium sp. TaxID=1872578 RepID=UPI00122B31B2|nr:sel1 repeat family protein [Aquabacterium sp.]TAK97164.1 MAG: sel1 repeat family protein [Aquabacterium sp.]